VKKNYIVGTFCTEIPLRVLFPGLKTDRRHKFIAMVSVELKGKSISAYIPEE